MQNAGLDEAQAGIKIARKNINNLRYIDDATIMAEREEEWKSFLACCSPRGHKESNTSEWLSCYELNYENQSSPNRLWARCDPFAVIFLLFI